MLSTFDYSWTTKAATQPVGIKEEMIKKSAMAPIWQVGESARSVRGSRARQRGLRGHQGEEPTQLLHSSIHPSSTEPSVCQDKQMRRHMLERLLENYWESFSSRTRWKEVCNPGGIHAAAYCNPVILLHTFIERGWVADVHQLPSNVRRRSILNKEGFIMKNALKLHYGMKSVVLALLNSNSLMLIHNDLSRWEKNKLLKS